MTPETSRPQRGTTCYRSAVGGVNVQIELILEVQILTQHLALFGGTAFVNAPGFGVFRDRGRHRDERSFGDVNAVADGGIHSKERERFDRAVARKHDVGSEGNVV